MHQPRGHTTGLVRMGVRRFVSLSEAERLMLDAAERGTRAECRLPAGGVREPANATAWPNECEIRAEILRWLCLSKEARDRVDPKGVSVRGARFTGALDLEGTKPGWPIALTESAIADGVKLSHASFPYFNLQGSHIGFLEADRLEVTGSLFLQRGFRSTGPVRLRGARIGGNLNCTGAQIAQSEDVVFDAQDATVSGSILLRDGFRAEGSIFLLGVRIGKDLDCESAALIAPGYTRTPAGKSKRRTASRRQKIALTLEGAEVGGTVFMRSRPGTKDSGNGFKPVFRTLGGLRIFSTKIEGALECDGAKLVNAGGPALMVEQCRIGRSLLLRQGFRAVGSVRLYASAIEGALDLAKASLRCISAPSLDADYVKVGGPCVMSHLASLGPLQMARVVIQEQWICAPARIRAPGRYAINAPETEIGSSVLFNHGLRIDGGINLTGSKIHGSLEAVGAVIVSPKITTEALNLEGARVDGNILLRGEVVHGDLNYFGKDLTGSRRRLAVRTFVAVGSIRMLGAQVGGDLDCSGSRLLARRRIAMELGSTRVGGSVRLAPIVRYLPQLVPVAFRAYARINLYQATVSGDLDCRGAQLLNRTGHALSIGFAKINGVTRLGEGFRAKGIVSLVHANIGRIDDEASCWPAKGQLALDGLTYNAITNPTSEGRLDWLERQDPAQLSLQPYEQLALVLRRNGQEREARNVAIAKQHAYRRAMLHGWRFALHWLYGATIRYGYKPHFAARFAPVLVAAAWFVLTHGGAELMRPAKDAALAQWTAPAYALPKGYPDFIPWAYSIEAFVPGLNLKQREYWEPDEHATCSRGPQRCGFWLKVGFWIYSAVGAAITALFGAGLAGITRKD